MPNIKLKNIEYLTEDMDAEEKRLLRNLSELRGKVKELNSLKNTCIKKRNEVMREVVRLIRGNDASF